MSTRAALCAAILSVASAPALAQPAPDDFESPVAPALVVAGVQPTAVTLPTTPRALAVDALSALAATSSGLPETYALQIAPYWLLDQPWLAPRQYFHPDFADSLARTLTVSAAITPVPGGMMSQRRIGFGARVAVFADTDATESRAIDEAIAAAEAANADLATCLQSVAADTGSEGAALLDAVRPDAERLRLLDAIIGRLTAPNEPLSAERAVLADRIVARVGTNIEEEDVDPRLRDLWSGDPIRRAALVASRGLPALLDARGQSLDALRSAVTGGDLTALRAMLERAYECGELDDARRDASELVAERMDDFIGGRTGLNVELAAGTAFDFDIAGAVPTFVSRVGVWLTASYRPDRFIQFLGVCRLTGVDLGQPTGGVWIDYGARLIVPIDDLTLGVEVLGRGVFDPQQAEGDTFRLAGTVDYRASDDVSFHLAAGRDFVTGTTTKETAFAIFGARFSFGDGRLRREDGT